MNKCAEMNKCADCIFRPRCALAETKTDSTAPHKCTVCDGTGHVQRRYIVDDDEQDPTMQCNIREVECDQCDGKGIIAPFPEYEDLRSCPSAPDLNQFALVGAMCGKCKKTIGDCKCTDREGWILTYMHKNTDVATRKRVAREERLLIQECGGEVRYECPLCHTVPEELICRRADDDPNKLRYSCPHCNCGGDLKDFRKMTHYPAIDVPESKVSQEVKDGSSPSAPNPATQRREARGKRLEKLGFEDQRKYEDYLQSLPPALMRSNFPLNPESSEIPDGSLPDQVAKIFYECVELIIKKNADYSASDPSGFGNFKGLGDDLVELGIAI